jgi:hypothetical protein
MRELHHLMPLPEPFNELFPLIPRGKNVEIVNESLQSSQSPGVHDFRGDIISEIRVPKEEVSCVVFGIH